MTETNPTDLLELIKGKASISHGEYESLKAVLYGNLFNKIPIILCKIPKGNFLFRTVPVFRKDISIGRKKYISYRPSTINAPYFNRCSEPQQSHFYCATDRIASIGECSYFISASEDPDIVFDKESELLEVGVWEVMKDLYVADLRFGEFSHPETKEHLESLKSRYREFAKDKVVIDFFDHINQSFETPINKKNHLEYWLTACYSNYLFDERFSTQPGWGNLKEIESAKMMHIDGIFYHSVKGLQTNPPISGFNLVLRNELIDNLDLKLNKAAIFKSIQVNENTFNLDEQVMHNVEIVGNSWTYNNARDVSLK